MNKLKLKDMEHVIIGFLIIFFGLFLYWAYLPDYKMNPKEFWRTLIGMPIGIFLGSFGFNDLNERLKKWVVNDTNKNPDE